MSVILAVDTSGASLSVALMVGGKLIFECTEQSGRTHSEKLMPLIDNALSVGKIALDQVDLFACTNGPGSFTGVRIGVAAIKGLSHATNRPAIGIDTLWAIAHGALLFEGPVCALMDARAGQVYAAAFLAGDPIISAEALALEDFLKKLPAEGRICFAGDGAANYQEMIRTALGERALFLPEAWALPRASSVALLAHQQREQSVSAFALMPAYLRAPQAERERLKKERGDG